MSNRLDVLSNRLVQWLILPETTTMSGDKSMATIRDVAKESGVSVATVSYVINNGPRPVGALTRERVLDVMRRMNYRPNATAQRLAGRQMHTVGVLFGYIEAEILTNPYAATVLQGILSAAREVRYNVTLFSTPWVSAEVSAVEFRDGRTDGILVIAPVMDSDVIRGLSELGIPVVGVSSPSQVIGVPYVEVNNDKGARLAVQYLLSLGHTKIAYFGGDENHTDILMRRNAFIAAMKEAGLTVPPTHIPEGTYDWDKARPNIRRLLTLPGRPTAIFAGNDTLAILCLEAARELNLRVPEDLSIIGFDDLPTASVVSPPLSTVRQPLTEIGAQAMRLLVQSIEAEENSGELPDVLNTSKGVLLEPELIIRGSSGPPPSTF